MHNIVHPVLGTAWLVASVGEGHARIADIAIGTGLPLRLPGSRLSTAIRACLDMLRAPPLLTIRLADAGAADFAGAHLARRRSLRLLCGVLLTTAIITTVLYFLRRVRRRQQGQI